ncbi:hypothetical protein HYY75_13145 [bacterium]|nr:hypothetical protein [bacterium]
MAERFSLKLQFVRFFFSLFFLLFSTISSVFSQQNSTPMEDSFNSSPYISETFLFKEPKDPSEQKTGPNSPVAPSIDSTERNRIFTPEPQPFPIEPVHTLEGEISAEPPFSRALEKMLFQKERRTEEAKTRQVLLPSQGGKYKKVSATLKKIDSLVSSPKTLIPEPIPSLEEKKPTTPAFSRALEKMLYHKERRVKEANYRQVLLPSQGGEIKKASASLEKINSAVKEILQRQKTNQVSNSLFENPVNPISSNFKPFYRSSPLSPP